MLDLQRSAGVARRGAQSQLTLLTLRVVRRNITGTLAAVRKSAGIGGGTVLCVPGLTEQPP